MIQLYAFADGLRSLPPLAGSAGERVVAAPVGGLTAVIGATPDPAAASPEAALAHGFVVEALRDRCDSVLPVRFGERFADERALLESAQPRVAELRRALDGVRSCIELAVSVSCAAPRERRGPASDGASYMRDRLAAYTEHKAAATRVHEPLRELARDSCVTSSARGDACLAAAYLVHRDDVRQFLERVDELAADNPGLTLVCTGPWAPYSFAEGTR